MIEHRFPKRFSREEPLRLLFLSNLLPGKGHDELVSAIQLLNEDERDCVKVDFAGGFQSDDERQRFEEKISALSNITYHGVVRGETKRTLLHNAHVLCLPTYYPYEGQPIAILEGYAAGCTVFTTDHSGIFDIFTPEVNGIALDKGSPESVRNAIRAALSSPETLIRTAQANSKLAREQYRAHDYAERLLGILRGVTSPNG